MSDIKNQVQNIDPSAKPRDIEELISKTNNIYETLSIIGKRASTLAVDIKLELHGKLDEFAVNSETIEEVQENKEQIEISKFYEKLPNPAVIAMHEYLDDKLEVRYKDKDEDFS